MKTREMPALNRMLRSSNQIQLGPPDAADAAMQQGNFARLLAYTRHLERMLQDPHLMNDLEQQIKTDGVNALATLNQARDELTRFLEQLVQHEQNS